VIRMTSGEEIIPKTDFKTMIADKKVIETSAGQGGIIYIIKDMLERNAMTIKALMEKTGRSKNTILNAINHLRTRKKVNVARYLNSQDGKFYYFIQE